MRTISRTEICELLQEGEEPSLSMYLAMQTPAGDTRQNFRSFLNSLRCMEEELQDRGYTPGQISRLLEPAYKLRGDSTFWNDQRSTLAYFLSQNGHRYWKIEEELTPQLYVDSCYHVRPLLRLLRNDQRYYLLALSQKQVRLWRGSADNLEAIELPYIGGIAEVTQSDLTREGSQHHTAQPALRGKESSSFHGHGGIPDTHKVELTTYCRAIDSAIVSRMPERLPLFVATVGYLFPIFQKVCSYPMISDKPIEGNPDSLSPAELRGKVSERLLGEHAVWEDDLGRFAVHAGSGRTSDSLYDIVPAAERGQVEALFTVEEEHRWGHLENTTGQIFFDPEGRSGAADLYEKVVAAVLLHGGRVHVLERGGMPTTEPIAALYRYPLPAGQPI